MEDQTLEHATTNCKNQHERDLTLTELLGDKLPLTMHLDRSFSVTSTIIIMKTMVMLMMIMVIVMMMVEQANNW